MKKQLHIFGGGTFSYVRNHLALSAPAFGQTARQLHGLVNNSSSFPEWESILKLTKMAAPSESSIITNEHLMMSLVESIQNPSVKAIIFNAAVCDYSGQIVDEDMATPSGKTETRLKTSDDDHPLMILTPRDKLVRAVKPIRPDINLVSFKTTCGETIDEMTELGRISVLKSRADAVLVNDTKTYNNILYVASTNTPNFFGKDRRAALRAIISFVTV